MAAYVAEVLFFDGIQGLSDFEKVLQTLTLSAEVLPHLLKEKDLWADPRTASRPTFGSV